MQQPISQFWMDVIHAYNLVSVSSEVSVTVARNGHEAVVEPLVDSVVITIREVETESKEPLPGPR
jgi:hypothetical protein